MTKPKRFLTLSLFLACWVLLAWLWLGKAQRMGARLEPVIVTPRYTIADRASVPRIQNSSPVIAAENTKLTPTPAVTPVLVAFSPALTSTLTLTWTPVVTWYLPLTVLGSALPDLRVRSMGITLRTGHSCNYTSTQLGVRVGFDNIGLADAGPFVVEVNGAQQTFVSGLGCGQADTLWFPGYVYFEDNVAFVDATFLVKESNENNNQLFRILPIPTLPPTCTPTTTP